MAVRKLEDFIDNKGMVIAYNKEVGVEPDGGDSIQTTSQMYISKYITSPGGRSDNAKEFYAIMEKCSRGHQQHGTDEPQFQLVRYWNDLYWPGQLWIMSRDNLEAPWAAAALYAPYNEDLKVFFDLLTSELIKRGGFTWNYKHIWPHPDFEPKIPDLVEPWSLAARAIRGYRLWYLYPILFLLDLDTLVTSVIRVIKSWFNPDNTASDLNHQGRLVFKQLVYWTPIVWLAKYIYRLRRRPTLEPGEESLGNVAIEVYQSYYWEYNDPPAFEFWVHVTRRYL